MSEKIIAIVANGEILNSEITKTALKSVEVTIAADGGVITCKQTNITPDFIIGDCDSISKKLKAYFSDVEIIHLPDQYSTDMEKALNFAKSFSPDRIRILSAFGKRMDHTSANLLFLSEFNKTTPVEIYDNYGKMTILNSGHHTCSGMKGKLISFYSMQSITNLSLKGFRYPLVNESFDPFFVGVSNVCEKDNCEVRFDSGTLFMYEVLNES